MLDREDPGIHNQAVMEFGAMVCTPANPACGTCPLQAHCQAYARNRVGELPVRGKPAKQKHRYFHYFIIPTGNGILIRQRSGKDIWQHLFDFPLIETTRPASTERLMDSPSWEQLFGNSRVKPARVSGIIKHTLTHQVIHAKFYHMEKAPVLARPASTFRDVPLGEIGQFPVPKLIENYLEKLMD
jgi:A/G-specific adenine glycosylase